MRKTSEQKVGDQFCRASSQFGTFYSISTFWRTGRNGSVLSLVLETAARFRKIDAVYYADAQNIGGKEDSRGKCTARMAENRGQMPRVELGLEEGQRAPRH